MLHNFGQRSGLYASFDDVNKQIMDVTSNAKNLVVIPFPALFITYFSSN